MSDLYFSHTKEHALLACVIDEAQRSQSVQYLGRTALQKVMYFLKALGVPIRYKFEIYHYGPFADQITSDLELLIADGVIVNASKDDRYFNYKVQSGANLTELLAPHKALLDEHLNLIKSVVSVFGGLDPNALELYATLHHAYRYEIAGLGETTKAAVIARFTEYKGEKFPRSQVAKALDEMVRVRLIKVQN